jgi:peptidase M28-like protein
MLNNDQIGERGGRATGRVSAAALALVASVACLSADQTAAPKPPAAAFEGARALEHVRNLVAIGPRVAGTPGAQQARDYIKKEMAAVGLEVAEQPFDASTPLGQVHMVNVRATVPGSSPTASGRLVVAGHYDTKLFREFVFVGANDGGSSAAFLIELARVLKAQPLSMPVELLWLDGEEATGEWEGDDHTYGSRYYASAARRDNTLKDLKALILVDMIGDRQLKLKREENSTRWLKDIIWRTAHQMQRPEFVDQETPLEDDHLEFLRLGVPAVDLIDLEYPDETSRYWHTEQDTLDKVSAEALQAVGDVLVASLPEIAQRARR